MQARVGSGVKVLVEPIIRYMMSMWRVPDVETSLVRLS